MNRTVINIVAVILITAIILGISTVMAGAFGALLGLFLLLAILIRFLSYVGLFALPAPVRRLANWVIFIAVISITAVWAATAWEKAEQRDKAKQAKLQAQAQVELQKRTEKFYLPACDDNGECEEIPTVDSGPGTVHRVRADAPWRLISENVNGGRTIYTMAAGWDTLTGTEPAGRIRAMNKKGSKKETLIEIARVR